MTNATARKQANIRSGAESAPSPASAVSTAKPVVYRSEGQRLFAATPGTLRQIAQSIGASKQSVVWWKSGDKMPGDGFRATIEKIYGIGAREWDRAAQEQVPEVARLAHEPRSSSSAHAVEGYADLIEICQKLLLKSDQLKPADTLKAVAEVRALRAQLDRQQRHAKKTVTDREIVRSVAWVQLREVLGTALKPYPEALAAVVEALKKLDV